MKHYFYMAVIFILYAFVSTMDYQDQVNMAQSSIVECGTDYDCMIKNPNIEEY